MAEVDLVLTCFERTYRKVLSSEHVNGVVAQNQFKFKSRIVVINNVISKTDARSKADNLLQSGEIDAYYFVDEHIAQAYQITNLSEKKLGRLMYFSDAFLVAACTPGSELMLHWDADVTLDRHCDWLTPSLDLMQDRDDIFAVNPLPKWAGVAKEESWSISRCGSFVIGDGFTDHCFLVRRAEIAQPIYEHFALSSMRFTHGLIGFTFEARIDAYMRANGRLRATYMDVGVHLDTPAQLRLTDAQLKVTTKREATAESELLLLCARVTLDDAARDRIKQLCAQEINWNVFLTAAETHALTPLAYWHLKSICKDILPGDKIQALSELFMDSAGRCVRLSAELASLISLFEKHGVSCIPFKGPVLAESLYGGVTLRPTGDLDILVPKEAVMSAIKLLRERGYAPCPWRDGPLPETFFHSAQFPNVCWEYTFFSQDEGIFVDLHWQLMANEFLPLDWADLMQHVEKRSFQGTMATVFDDELSLMLLCAHASHHGWYRMNWIVDIAQLLDRMQDVQNKDWDRFFDWARASGTERMVLLGVYLTRFLPRRHSLDKLDDRIKAQPYVEALGDVIMQRFLRDPTALECKELRRWTFKLSLKEKWRDKLRLLLALVSKPTIDECVRRPLPDALFSMYSVLRPLYLCVDHIPRIATRLITGGYDRNLDLKE